MKSSFVSLASVAFFVSAVLGQTLQINTPNSPVECEPTLLSWSGGTGPYYLSVLPGGQPGAAALQNLGEQTGTSYTWSTNISAGTSVGLDLRDSTGTVAQTAAFTIQPGSTSCLTGGSGSSSSGGSTTAGSSSSSSSSSTSAVTSGTAAGSTTAGASTPGASSTSPASHSTSASASAASTTKSSAALPLSAQYGAAGIVGAALAALLA